MLSRMENYNEVSRWSNGNPVFSPCGRTAGKLLLRTSPDGSVRESNRQGAPGTRSGKCGIIHFERICQGFGECLLRQQISLARKEPQKVMARQYGYSAATRLLLLLKYRIREWASNPEVRHTIPRLNSSLRNCRTPSWDNTPATRSTTPIPIVPGDTDDTIFLTALSFRLVGDNSHPALPG